MWGCLVDRPGRLQRRREEAPARGKDFFPRHGASAVFFGRWLPGLRGFVTWLAGANHMPWPRFLIWNAPGTIGWASTVGSVAYLLGPGASGWSWAIGLVGLAIASAVELIRRLAANRTKHARSAHPHTRDLPTTR